MERHWLLSNTCYGSWLPGSQGGFVGRVWEHRPEDSEQKLRVTHNAPGTDYDAALPGLENAARSRMKGAPVLLTREHAETLLAQLQETAAVRGWTLRAVAIMANHFHIVVTVPGDPSPSKILGTSKAGAHAH